MSKPQVTGLRRVFNAGRYSWQGLLATWNNEAAFRQEVIMALIAVPLAVIIAETALEVLLLLGVLILVMVVELINSAIESVVDRWGQERHELAGRAKDQGSAAVLLALSLAAATWIIVGVS